MEGPDNSLIETVLEPFNRVGTVGRGLMKGALGGKRFSLDDTIAALTGEKKVESEEVIEQLKKATNGFVDLTNDKTFEQMTKGEVAGIMARDFAVDLVASPLDGIIGLPAKLLKAGKVIKSPLAQRAVVGATFGALSIEKDDDFTDVLTKLGTGAAAGATLNPALRAAGRGVKRLATPVMDNLMKGTFPEVLGKIDAKDFSKSFEINKASFSRDEVAGASRRYYKGVNDVTDNIRKQAIENGASPKDAVGLQNQFRELLGEGFSTIITARNLAQRSIKAVRDGSKSADEAVSDLVNFTSQEVGAVPKDVIGAIMASSREAGTEEQVLKLSTRFVNELFNTKMSKTAAEIAGRGSFAEELVERTGRSLTEKNILKDSIEKYTNVQRRLVGDFNSTMVKRGRDDLTFTPINFHTVDLKNVDSMMPKAGSTNFSEGAKMRTSSKVKSFIEGLTPEQVNKIGADRHAALYLTEAEKEAGSMMRDLALARQNPSTYGAKALKVYDQFLGLSKSMWLAGGVSWVINTLPETILKSYGMAGPKAAIKTMGNGLGASIYSIGNINQLKKANSLVDDGFFRKMARLASNEGSAVKIDAGDPWLNVGQDLGVVGSNFVQEAKKGLDDVSNLARGANSDEVVELVGKLSGKSGFGDARDALAKGFTDIKGDGLGEKIMAGAVSAGDAAEAITNTLWRSPFARIATTFEDTARLETFKAIYKNELKFADLTTSQRKFLNTKSPEDIIGSTQKQLGLEKMPANEFNEARRTALRLMKNSAAQTKDAFYDYGNVNALEKYVMKRLVPFYSFLSKDVEFWSRAVFDPTKTRLVGGVEAVQQGIGRAPTDEERSQMPRFLLQQGPRVRGDSFMSAPSLPMTAAAKFIDEINPFSEAETNITGNLAPAIRVPTELLRNENSFGSQIRPTERRPVVRMQDNALTGLIKKFSPATLEAMGITVDPRDGRLYTSSDSAAVLGKVFTDSPLNVPIVNQLITRPAIDRDFRDAENPILRQFTPVKTNFSTQQQRMRLFRQRMRNQNTLESGNILPRRR